MKETVEQFENLIKICRELYMKKLQDYGAAWRIMRPCSLTDQILIKARRIRSIEIQGEALIEDSISSEFIGIVNYGIMALIQLELGYTEKPDIDTDKAIKLYDKHMTITKELMYKKNHDYNEAWRSMRISSYTDLILMKINRTKQIEQNDGKTIVSEGLSANYMDMVNYSLFGLIKLTYGD